jgi:hypothetical protein
LSLEQVNRNPIWAAADVLEAEVAALESAKQQLSNG